MNILSKCAYDSLSIRHFSSTNLQTEVNTHIVDRSHWRRKVGNIGGPRFRILEGGKGGGQIPSRHMTS